MLWNWNVVDSCFLAASWHVKDSGMFAASCIAVVFMVIVLEGFRRLNREYEQWILRSWQAHAASLGASEGLNMKGASECGEKGQRAPPRVVTYRVSTLQQTVRAIMHAVIFGLAYIVMLLVMSYNGYIIICVIVGAGLGKFLCDWMTTKIVVGAGMEETAQLLSEPTVCCG